MWDRARSLLPGHRVELIDGRIVVNDAPTRRQTELVATLLKLLADKVVEQGWTVHTDITVFLGARADRYVPDLVVVPRGPRMRGAGEVHGEDTHLVVDVVAACSVHDDRVTKPREHARAGVPLHLVVDPEAGTATLHSLPADEGYRRHVRADLGTPVQLPEPWALTLDTRSLIGSGEPKPIHPASFVGAECVACTSRWRPSG